MFFVVIPIVFIISLYMKIKTSKWLINILFFTHLTIIISWFGLFFIFFNFWPKIFLFYVRFTLIIIFLQFSWAFMVFKKIDMICPLTTWVQHLRWYKIIDEKNYKHSFVAEILQKLKINISSKAANTTQKFILIGMTGMIIFLYTWLDI